MFRLGGLIPGFGGTQRLARVIGRNLAREIIYTGKNIQSHEAIEIGLVNKVLNDKEDLIAEAKNTLIKMKNNSMYAIGKAKRATLKGLDLDLPAGLKFESEIFSDLFDSYDAKEGTLAFAEKRVAKFQHLKGEN